MGVAANNTAFTARNLHVNANPILYKGVSCDHGHPVSKCRLLPNVLPHD
ncbi:hypothetical protein AGR7C_pTi0025 [Agrobacterium deltaense Zutra 3/1]|uniref:Uncharacterized protein n=1 Tax=Agrobacterium deltaense Zutra 3/1 TaxID=1183427 RepID=A0A1S7S507_9HYPH|nr:hypothetical protein AGR7C_pTi0025 [Agrobacterium deltaense Zutra 3/1]